MSFTDLPIEILDRIAGYLNSPADIRNFARISTRLHAVASPRHTQFRVVRSPLHCSIWEKFIINRSLAQNVRQLELQSAERLWNRTIVEPPVIPSIFKDSNENLPTDDDNAHLSDKEDNSGDLSGEETDRMYRNRKNATDLFAERVFVSALRNMTGLISFTWSRMPPLIDPKVEDDVYATLATHCPNLRQLEVLDGQVSYSDDETYQRITHNPSFFTLKHLQSLRLITNVGSSVPSIDRFVEMLTKHSPDLEVLHLVFLSPDPISIDISPLLSRAHWKYLSQLSLSPIFASPRLLSGFLASHPTLEYLTLMNSDNDDHRVTVAIPHRLVLPPNSLPSLKYIDAESPEVFSILRSPTAHPRPLEHIRNVPLCEDLLDLLEKSGSGPTLKRLDAIACYPINTVMRLAKLAPGLEWLDLHYPHGRLRCPPYLSWYLPLSRFPSLTTFLGVQLLAEDNTSQTNSETLRTLLSVCPKLHRLSWYSHSYLGPIAVVIEREGKMVKWELRARLGSNVGEIVDDYGEDGRGSFELGP